MPETNKSDHDLLVEIRTLLSVVQDTLKELKEGHAEQAKFNNAITGRVHAIEIDRAGKIEDFNNLKLEVSTLSKLAQQAKGAKLVVHGLLVTCGILAGAFIEGIAKGLIH